MFYILTFCFYIPSTNGCVNDNIFVRTVANLVEWLLNFFRAAEILKHIVDKWCIDIEMFKLSILEKLHQSFPKFTEQSLFCLFSGFRVAFQLNLCEGFQLKSKGILIFRLFVFQLLQLMKLQQGAQLKFFCQIVVSVVNAFIVYAFIVDIQGTLRENVFEFCKRPRNILVAP